MSIALYAGGWLRSGFFPKVNSDYVFATVAMPEGGPFSATLAVRDRLLQVAQDLKADWNSREEFMSVPAIGGISNVTNGNNITLTLGTVSDRVDTEELAREFRNRVGPLPEAKEVRMDFTIMDPGKPHKAGVCLTQR